MGFELIYSDENDKAYGLAGMAISIASLDALERITEVHLDADGPMVAFSREYFYGGSPSVSPKATWNHLMANFQLTTSMVLGNVLARTLVKTGRDAERSVYEKIRDVVREEGSDSCGLEPEEADMVFDKMLRHSLQLFHNPRLHPAVRQLVGVLTQRRRLSVVDLAEELDMLRI